MTAIALRIKSKYYLRNRLSIANQIENIMKTRLIWILSAYMLLNLVQVANSQTTYNVGGHVIYYNNGNYFKITNNDTIRIISDKIVIKFKDNVSEGEKGGFSSAHGFVFLNATKSGITVYSIPNTSQFIGIIESISTDTRVKYYDLNYELSYYSTQPPNNDIPGYIWNSNETVMWPYENTQLYDAWNITHGIPEIIVANLDNGIVLNHEDLGKGIDLYSNIWVNKNEIPENGLDDDDNLYTDDYYGWNFGIINGFSGNNDVTHKDPLNYRHGTMTSGIISAKTNNDRGVFGIAGGWNEEGVKTMMVKTANLNDRPESAQIPLAIEYAVENGARVINMAWGVQTNIQSIEEEIIDHYISGNVTYLAAVGNNHQYSIPFPASSHYVIAVGATEFQQNNVEKKWTDNNNFAGSNWGDSLEIMAPGCPMVISLVPSLSGEYTYETQSESGFYCSTSAAVSFASGVVALMLSGNPCLENHEIRTILRNTCNKITGGFQNYKYDQYPDRPGFCLDMGYGRINAKMALEECVPGESITIIQPETTWTTDQTIYYDLTIEDGGVLNITGCAISVYPNAKIIVKPGGKLIVNNAILQGICGYTWKGIEVWGTSEENQWPNSNGQYMQGYVELTSAVIENANTALNLWKPGDYTKTGGIVIASKTDFINNRESVHALYYENHHPNGKPMDYQAVFTKCTFNITDAYNPEYQFFKHINLNQVNGIRFNGCDFSLSPDARGISNYNHAIASYSAGFKVNAICEAAGQNGCAEYDPCTFTGFRNAITANNGSINTNTFYVNRAEFNNNNIGIAVNSVPYPIIINSNFYLENNKYRDEFCSYGIYLEKSIGFAIEENKFFKADGAPLANYFGIGSINCETVVDIYKNEFTGLSAGNYAYGKNFTGQTAVEGLTYSCNKNTSSWTDFYITGNPEVSDYGIQFWQGSPALPAGNTFSQNGNNWHIYNEKYNPIIYHHCTTCPDETPVHIGYVSLVPVNTANTCPSHYGGNSGMDVVLNTDQKNDREVEFAIASSNYTSVEILYNQLKDGGSTPATTIDINTAVSSDMWLLRAKLLGDSPHLSKEVLKLVADKTEVFPESVIFDILAANPDELRGEELLKYVAEKEIPLPEYMIEILRQISTGTTYKTVLQQEMARYSHDKARSANDMIRSILNEDELDIIQLRNWLSNFGGIESDKQIIATYLQEGNFSAAFALANTIPQMYNLQQDELTEHNRYINLLQLEQTLFNDGRRIDQLTPSEQDMLNEFALVSDGSTGAQARGILESFYGADFNDCKSLDGEESFKNTVVNPNLLGEAYGLSISVKPNPARDWATFDYTLPRQESVAVLEITDSNGKSIETMNLSGNQGQKLWDTRNIPSGFYIITIKVSGFLKSVKLIISK